MSEHEVLDLMAPVVTEAGTTVWIKVGVFFPNDRSGKHVGTISILTLPVGAQAPLRLYAYPAEPKKERKPRAAQGAKGPPAAKSSGRSTSSATPGLHPLSSGAYAADADDSPNESPFDQEF